MCGKEALSVNAAELDAESSDEDSPIGDGTSLNGSSLLVPSVPLLPPSGASLAYH